MNDMESLRSYLKDKKYPPNLTKNEKRNLGRTAEQYQCSDSGVLLYRDGREVVDTAEEKQQKIKQLHEGLGGAHLGRDKTAQKVVQRYFWKNIWQDVTVFIQSCQECQSSSKVVKNKKPNRLHSIPVTDVWKQVGVDLIGPLPITKNGHRYIITLCDFHSKWPEAAALRTKSAAEVSEFLTNVMMSVMMATQSPVATILLSFNQVTGGPSQMTASSNLFQKKKHLETREIKCVLSFTRKFPMLTAHLDSIMRGDSYSDRHSKYMRAVKDKHIKHVRLVSEELLLALLQQLEEHYYEVPPSVPVAPRDIFKPQQQKFFKLPSALKNNLKELGYFEVESAYLRDVLLVESIAFIARNILGLTEREARDATFA